MNRPFTATLVLLAATFVLAAMAERRVPVPVHAPLASFPERVLDWSAERDLQLSAGDLSVLSPTTYLSRYFRRGDQELELFVAYYAEQRPGQNMHSPQHCLPGSGWAFVDAGTRTLNVGPKTVTVNRYMIQRLGTRMLMLYWYQTPDGIIANEYRLKLSLMRHAAFSGRTAGSIVRIVMLDSDGADSSAEQFAAAAIPSINRVLYGSE